MTLHLVPGTEMSTQEIANKLQVSRTPVREAFIQLQREGLVEAIPQKGTKVSRINLKRVHQERFLRESLELSVIEPFLNKVSISDFERLKVYIEEQKDYYREKKYAEFVLCDNHFHKLLFDVAQQQLSWEVISNYNGHYNRLRVLTIQDEETIAGTIHQHEKMIRLMEEKNTESVYAETKNHVRKILLEKENLVERYPDFFVNGEESEQGILLGRL